MATRPTRWEIEEFFDRNTRDTVVDVKRDGRAFAYDLDDLDEALRRIQRSPKFDPDDEIFFRPQDGQRRRVRL